MVIVSVYMMVIYSVVSVSLYMMVIYSVSGECVDVHDGYIQY